MNKGSKQYTAGLVAGLMFLYVVAMAGQQTGQHVGTGTFQPRRTPGKESIWSPDHKLRAVVIYVNVKPRPDGLLKSQVEIWTASNHQFAHTNYSSSYGTQGGGIARAAWTANSRFFVCTTESGGGHQPWHHPIFFFSQRRHRFYSLDKTLGRMSRKHRHKPGIVEDGSITGGMELVPPCILVTRGRVYANMRGVKVKPSADGNALTINLGQLDAVLTPADEDR